MNRTVRPLPSPVYKTAEGCTVLEAWGTNRRTGAKWLFVTLRCEKPLAGVERRK